MRKLKSIFTSAAIFAGLITSASTSLASPTFGYDAEAVYSDHGCDYGNRVSAIAYANNFYNGLFNKNLVDIWNSTGYQDNMAWASDVTGGFANSKTIFLFSGHGHPADVMASGGNNKGAGLHFYTMNSSSTYHPATGGSNGQWGHFSYAAWDDIRLGSGSNRWSIFYACRILKDAGDSSNTTRIKQMFNGTHMIMGFASRMYLTSTEGTVFANNLGAKDGSGNLVNTWKYSFFNSAEQYQPALDPLANSDTSGYTVARIYGYKDNIYTDKANSSTAAAPVYSTSNANDFYIIDNWIKDVGTGQS
jgi:hypothetical protein